VEVTNERLHAMLTPSSFRLTAALVGQPIERRLYDITRGETRTEAFLTGVNANGRIPVLQMGDLFLPESNAACWYLGHGTPLVPQDRYDQADVLRWMFFEQYNHEPNVATLRFWLGRLGEDALTDQQRAQLPAKRAAGEAALRLMDEHLARHVFFVGTGITVADIALYAYTHVGEDGGFVLASYPHVQAWITRVEAEPAYIPMG